MQILCLKQIPTTRQSGPSGTEWLPNQYLHLFIRGIHNSLSRCGWYSILKQFWTNCSLIYFFKMRKFNSSNISIKIISLTLVLFWNKRWTGAIVVQLIKIRKKKFKNMGPEMHNAYFVILKCFKTWVTFLKICPFYIKTAFINKGLYLDLSPTNVNIP